MADINIIITVIFGVIGAIMVFVGIVISRVQKRISMIALMQPLTKDPKAYKMFLEYMSQKWFNKRERKKIEDAIRRMNIKVDIASGRAVIPDESLNDVRKALSGEEIALQKILKVLEEINKKPLLKEEGGEKISIIHVNVREGFGNEKAKAVVQKITKVFEDLGIPPHAVEVIVHEISKSHGGIGGGPASEKLKDISPK